MKILMMFFVLTSCAKNIKELVNKSKGKEDNYWQYIIENKDKELKEYLDQNNLNLNEVLNNDGERVLILAAKHNSLAVLKILLNRGFYRIYFKKYY